MNPHFLWMVNSLPNFQKWEELDRISIFLKGISGKEGSEHFQGMYF